MFFTLLSCEAVQSGGMAGSGEPVAEDGGAIWQRSVSPSPGCLAWARRRMGMARRGTEVLRGMGAPQGMVVVARRSGPRCEMEAPWGMVAERAGRRPHDGRAKSGEI
jgi:hypothetical protein